ncbi:SDR family NAD(P)-dependent oxidoreductase [Marinicauda algicola]|uniref:SDR family NAD(P)-dependent oxidoreductase n=1 Tax=Marinicauda algicola TaxID=2029849 RepID=A0A4S2H0U0_9PROT|nr:SDR family NAD(P)-dependent oxidoreductase [Marinicauda algicola]
MAQAARVLLIGYGYVAKATARRLKAAGIAVTATTRSAGTGREIEAAGHAACVCDPATREGGAALRAAAREASHVISSVPPGEDGDPVLAALEGGDLSRTWLGYLSTTGVYGDRGGGWAFEWDAPTPGQDRSVRRQRAEEGWSALGARLFRLGGIYGPGRSAIDRLREGSARRIDDPGQVFCRIHVEDIASCLVLAVRQPGPQGAFNLVDDWPSPQAEVVEGAARLLGMEPPPLEALEQAQMSAMARSFYDERRRVSNARAKAAYGWRLQFPSWREGLPACL